MTEEECLETIYGGRKLTKYLKFSSKKLKKKFIPGKRGSCDGNSPLQTHTYAVIITEKSSTYANIFYSLLQRIH